MSILDNEGHDPQGFGNAPRRPPREDDIAECHRLLNEAGVPGNHRTGEKLAGRVRAALAKRNTFWRALVEIEHHSSDKNAAATARAALALADAETGP